MVIGETLGRLRVKGTGSKIKEDLVIFPIKAVKIIVWQVAN